MTDDDFGGAVFARERREISRSGRAKGSRRDPHETPTAMDQARGSLEDLNLTKEEVDKFQNAFKDEAFKKMFAEYAAEIADPKNKAESDAYLRQLEMEGKIESVYGKDVQLVMPKAGFVAKTFDEAPADDAPSTSSPNDRGSGTNSSSDGKTRLGRKVFVNVCHSDKCEDATSEKRPGGLQWSVPHTLGQPHEEKDKAGETCVAYDFCVSENTYALAMRDERVKKMVTETAIEAVNRAFGTRLSLAFTTPRKTYVGPKTGPGVQAIKGKGKTHQNTHTPGGRVAPLGGAGSSSVGDGSSTTKASAFRFDDAVAGRQKKSPTSRKNEPAGECEPKHALVHREDGKDISKQFGRGSASREAERRRDTRPSALVLRVDLPKLDSVADAELDVGDSRVFFCVPGKYKLDLALPYEVFGDEGKAKFDKAARKLEVTLPVRPAPKPPAPAFSEPSERRTEELPETDEVPGRASTLPAELPEAPPGGSRKDVSVADGTDREEREASLETSQTKKSDDAEARAAASAAAAVAAAAAFDARGETENQRRWREMHEAREKQEKEEKEKEAEEELSRAAAASASSVSDAAATSGEKVGDEKKKASPSADGDVKKVVPSAAKIGAAAPAAAAAYLRPSLRGAAELGDELD